MGAQVSCKNESGISKLNLLAHRLWFDITGLKIQQGQLVAAKQEGVGQTVNKRATSVSLLQHSELLRARTLTERPKTFEEWKDVGGKGRKHSTWSTEAPFSG